MTNKEILQADMLDILFEHRNKLYGAYALRKTYSHRLGKALAVALSTVLLFVLMSFIKKNKNGHNRSDRNDPMMIVKSIEIPDEKPKDPDPPKEKPKPEIAQSDYQRIVVVPDEFADKDLVEVETLTNSQISDQNSDGKPDDGIAQKPEETNGTGTVPVKEPEPEKEIIPNRHPNFPGGTAAWLAFLQRYLQAPEDLEPGQRIEVQVRFWVDVDGSVSRPEIVKSGGSSFDKEVLRVMKKMPKWEPAIQGGNFVAIAYTQPVIFMGVE